MATKPDIQSTDAPMAESGSSSAIQVKPAEAKPAGAASKKGAGGKNRSSGAVRGTGTRSNRLPKGARGGIELLLIQSVEHLGKVGEVVEVRRGYAANYLLPQGLATIATDHHKRMIEKHRAKLDEIARERLAGLRSLLDELVRTSVTIEANANDEGHLYGSVGAAEISRSLKQQDLLVSPESIILQGPLKEVGLYTVKVRLAPEVEGDLKVWVVPSSGDAGAK
ncbi:MAG: 50S ribosomal protein L9 [Pirellulales bacterium]